jgi:hypothetical protein
MLRVELNNDEDIVQWTLTTNVQFTTASLYIHCAFSEVINVTMEELWQTSLS